jgi:hypothetical protein
MPVLVAQIAVSLIAHLGGPLMGVTPALSSEPPPLSPKPPRLSSAPLSAEPPPMQITISDEVTRVRGGENVAYEVIVINPRGFRLPVLVNVTLAPAAFSEIKAEDAIIVANALTWKGVLNTGRTRVLMVSGLLRSNMDARDLAATACVHLSPDTPPLACATDLDVIVAPPNGRWITWTAAIALGLLAVAGSVWLQRKITPALLTPASARSEFGPPDVPSQPGGAPSV